MPGDADLPNFTPIVIDDAAEAGLAPPSANGTTIEVQTSEVVLTTSSDIDPDGWPFWRPPFTKLAEPFRAFAVSTCARGDCDQTG